MGAKAYAGIAGLIFLAISIAQFTRAALGVDILIAGYSVPIVVSIIAGIVALLLAGAGFMISRS